MEGNIPERQSEKERGTRLLSTSRVTKERNLRSNKIRAWSRKPKRDRGNSVSGFVIKKTKCAAEPGGTGKESGG